MELKEDDRIRIIDSSKRLNKALKILHEEYYDKDIIPLIIKKVPSIHPLGASYFSKYKRVATESSYIKDIQEIKLNQIIKALDLLILEQYHKQWDEQNKDYKDVASLSDDDTETKGKDIANETKKLLGLHGIWTGISWNGDQSEKHRGDDFFTLFSVKIFGNNVVSCTTEKTGFDIGKIKPIGNDRIIIEFVTPSRRMYMMGKLGVKPNLSDTHGITVAYIDSGNDRVKSGIAVLIKAKDNLNALPIRNFLPIEEIPKDLISEDVIKFLKGTRHIAVNFDHLT